MIDYQLEQGVRLFKMLKLNPRICQSIMALAKKIIEMIHAENFKLSTLEFSAISPRGESDKIFITLTKGDYCREPIQVPEPPKDSSSMQLVGFVDSLFKALCGENGEMSGFLNNCQGLCDIIYSVCNYLYLHYYKYAHKDLPQVLRWSLDDAQTVEEWVKVEKDGASDCPLCKSSTKFVEWRQSPYGYLFKCNYCRKTGIRTDWPSEDKLISTNDLIIYTIIPTC